MPFNGLAIYNNGVFNTIADDVSEQISQISPFETPLLDRLSQAPRAAESVLHEWLEDELNPNTIVSSTTVSTVDTAFAAHKGGSAVSPYLQVGAVLKNNSTGEFLQITALNSNTISVSRGFGGTTAATITAGHEFMVIADAALEGSDVTGNISRPRVRKSNYCQIFKKDIIVSGTMQAVTPLGDVGNEYAYQLSQRMKETIRDLEKAVINGKLSGNTIGSGTAYRTMKGLWDFIATNATSTGTLTASVLDTVIQSAWAAGGTDCNLIIADATWKREIDSWNSTRVQVTNSEGKFRNKVTQYESTFGLFDVILGRWMPSKTLMVIAPSRVHVVPLKGRTYAHVPVARTGDSEKGMIIGEYTLEVRNEDGMAKAYG